MGSIDSLVVPTNWTLEGALDMIRALQPQTRQFHYHLCLGGGVLNNGQSEKDLDLYFLPLNYNSGKPDIPGLMKWLETVWGSSEVIGGGEYPESEAPYIRRQKFRYGQQRIDVFILGSPKAAVEETERLIREDDERFEREGDDDFPRIARARPRNRGLGRTYRFGEATVVPPRPATADQWVVQTFANEVGAFPTAVPTVAGGHGVPAHDDRAPFRATPLTDPGNPTPQAVQTQQDDAQQQDNRMWREMATRHDELVHALFGRNRGRDR